MKSKKLRQLWQEGHPAINVLLTIPSAWTAEVVAHSGYDAVTIDMQHGLAGFQTAVSMLQAIEPTTAVPLVRLRWNEPSHIMQVLDAGAAGVICPMINTAEDVGAFIQACYYPPQGIRSFGPIRARFYSEGDYFANANQNILTFAMIETATAAKNLESIAAVSGLDGLFVGPYDLSVSMGLQKIADIHDPDLHEILERVMEACNKNKLIAGIYTGSIKHAKELAEMGFQLVTHGTDTGFFEQAAKNNLTELRRSLGL